MSCPGHDFNKFFAFYILLTVYSKYQEVNLGMINYVYKVRKLLDLLTGKFKSNYTPSEYVTIDEAMIPFKGRLGFKQYIKDKPTKWGIKVFTLQIGMHIGFKYIRGKILRALVM